MNQQEIINEAKTALKKNPFGDFDTQAPHLTVLLEQLPPLEVNDPSIQAALARGGQQMGFEAVLNRLKASWMAQHPPTSHDDGAIDLEIGLETERLVITFSIFLWGHSNVVRRLEVARIGTERFLYWDQGQPAPPPVAEVAQGKVAAQKEKNDWLNRRWLAWLKGLTR
jgi:hypothetical protein